MENILDFVDDAAILDWQDAGIVAIIAARPEGLAASGGDAKCGGDEHGVEELRRDFHKDARLKT